MHEVRDEDSDSRRMMQSWIGSIMVAKEMLDGSDFVEYLVYQMLEDEGELRITAEEIVHAFSGSGSSPIMTSHDTQ